MYYWFYRSINYDSNKTIKLTVKKKKEHEDKNTGNGGGGGFDGTNFFEKQNSISEKFVVKVFFLLEWNFILGYWYHDTICLVRLYKCVIYSVYDSVNNEK